MFLGGAPTSVCHFFRFSMSVCPSVAHHISRTIHYLIIIFGTHVKNDDISRCFFHVFVFHDGGNLFWPFRKLLFSVGDEPLAFGWGVGGVGTKIWWGEVYWGGTPPHPSTVGKTLGQKIAKNEKIAITSITCHISGTV